MRLRDTSDVSWCRCFMVEREGQRREGGVRGMCVKKLGTQGFYKKLGQILRN